MEALDKGTNMLGQFYMMRNFFVGIILTLIFCGIGGLLSVQKHKKFTKVDAVINQILSKDKMGSTSKSSKSKTYIYELIITYKVNDETFTKTFHSTTIESLNGGDIIEIEYDPDNPNIIRPHSLSPKTVGYIFLGIGICISIVTLVSTFVLSKSKIARQYMGITSGANNLKKILS